MPLAALIHGQQQECGRDARFEEMDDSRETIAAVAGRGRLLAVDASQRTFIYRQISRMTVAVEEEDFFQVEADVVGSYQT